MMRRRSSFDSLIRGSFASRHSMLEPEVPFSDRASTPVSGIRSPRPSCCRDPRWRARSERIPRLGRGRPARRLPQGVTSWTISPRPPSPGRQSKEPGARSDLASSKPHGFRPRRSLLVHPRDGGARPLDGFRLRVHQRLPRHCQRRRHGHLHELHEACARRGVVGHLEPPRAPPRLDPRSRRGLLHRPASAGGPRGRVGPLFGNGDGPFDDGDSHRLEPRYLVCGPPSLQFPHPHRLGPRRGPRRLAPAGQRLLRRDALAQGAPGLHVAPRESPHRLHHGRPTRSYSVDGCCGTSASSAPRRAPSRLHCGSAGCSSSRAPASASLTDQTTARRGWAS